MLCPPKTWEMSQNNQAKHNLFSRRDRMFATPLAKASKQNHQTQRKTKYRIGVKTKDSPSKRGNGST